MPISYDIDANRNMVVISAYGTLTDAEVTACVERMLADKRTRLSMPSFVDIRDVEHLEVSKAGLEDMLAVVQRDGSPDSEAKIAVVTGRTGSLIVRLLEALADAEGTARQHRGFETGADAMAWLGTA
jgi:hypothetical protein